MLSNEARKDYELMARKIKSGRAGYQPAKKSKYSKLAKQKYGPAPDFL